MRFTLVHSPLVGPTTWSLVAEHLRGRGHSVAVPSLVKVARKGRWESVVDSAAAQTCDGDGLHVLVGHSGAGPLLPTIAQRMPQRPDLLVFVDAGVPSESDPTDLVPPAFFDHLRGLANDGRLPRWADWFDDDTLDKLVEDPAIRARARAEMPELPLAYFADRLPAVPGWMSTPAAYLLLSDPYGNDLAGAASRGWPVAIEAGHHLDMLNRPEAITDALLELAEAGLSHAR